MLLIGRYFSPFTRRVAVHLKLLDIPYEVNSVTAWDDIETVRKFNPVGRIPALVTDDGEVLFDSGVIVDYLDELVGPDRALTPGCGAYRRRVLKLSAAALGVMEKAAAARYELVMRPREKVHRPWLEHNLNQVRAGVLWLDRQLGEGWIYRERIGQAEVAIIVMYDFLECLDFGLFDDADACAGLKALHCRVNEWSAFSETYPVRA